MSIEYKTDGTLRLDADCTQSVVVKWTKGSGVVTLHAGKDGVLLSRSQFQTLAANANEILDDLQEK